MKRNSDLKTKQKKPSEVGFSLQKEGRHKGDVGGELPFLLPPGSKKQSRGGGARDPREDGGPGAPGGGRRVGAWGVGRTERKAASSVELAAGSGL